MRFVRMLVVCAATVTLCPARRVEPKRQQETLDEYIAAAEQRARSSGPVSSGSLFSATGPLANLARDPRATQVDDILTIVVADRASALSKGSVGSARSSSAKYSVGALGGVTRGPGPWSDLARAGGEQQLKGEAETTRENSIQTTLSARVTHVLPNGVMAVEGLKRVAINSETHDVVVRGLVRREDIGPANTIRSDRIANLEIAVNGRGVVGDAVRRPFILYRILLGLLPF